MQGLEHSPAALNKTRRPAGRLAQDVDETGDYQLPPTQPLPEPEQARVTVPFEFV